MLLFEIGNPAIDTEYGVVYSVDGVINVTFHGPTRSVTTSFQKEDVTDTDIVTAYKRYRDAGRVNLPVGTFM